MRMTNAEYHANPAIGSSMLKAFDRSPRHCWQLYFDPDRETPEPSKAFLLGSAIHAATLEPATFGERYAVAPVCDRRTKAGKAEWEAFAAANAVRTILAADEAETVRGCAKAVRENPLVEELGLLRGGAAEESFFFELSGTACKCRPDYIVWPCEKYPLGLIVDVKSCEDARAEAFRRDAWKYGYHIQTGFYQMGVAISLGLYRYPPFVFLAVEKSAPYGVAVYSASENFALVGRDRAGELLQRLKACRDAGLGAENWPGYPAELNELELPAWAN